MLDAVPYVAYKTTIIPNAADGQLYDPARWINDGSVRALREKYAGRKIILTVRRLNPKCGIQYLVEAMPEIIRRRPEILYVMVGTGRLENDIRVRVEALGIGKHVELIGLLPNNETPKYLATSDVVVFPSTAESTSISCIEAMLMEKSVVASRVGGLIELLGTDGVRGRLVKLVEWEASNYEAPPIEAVPKERITALADAVCDLLDDTGLRREMGEAARQYALAHFDWNVVMKRTIDIYESLASGVGRKA
jgi:glycosyltransferase involved in cell wall biosynthesis